LQKVLQFVIFYCRINKKWRRKQICIFKLLLVQGHPPKLLRLAAKVQEIKLLKGNDEK